MPQGQREEPSRPTINPAKRFSFSRLIEDFPPPRVPSQPPETVQATVAVFIVRGWQPRDGDILAPQGDWLPEILLNRYIRLWIFRHRHREAKHLINTLADAIGTARDEGSDIVLPELSEGPMVAAPPVKPDVQSHRRRIRRSRRGGHVGAT